jgi:hypothetical protein
MNYSEKRAAKNSIRAATTSNFKLLWSLGGPDLELPVMVCGKADPYRRRE